MKMQLIRNKDNGKIYLLDSDEVKHHIEAPTDFAEFMGEKAWVEQDWINMEAKQVEVYKEGLPISAKKTTMAKALSQLFHSFGKNKS